MRSAVARRSLGGNVRAGAQTSPQLHVRGNARQRDGENVLR